jgi:hypothetical protein
MTAALEGMSGQQHAPAALYAWERPDTHFTGGCVVSRVGLDGGKNLFPTGILSRNLQPIVSRYTGCILLNILTLIIRLIH